MNLLVPRPFTPLLTLNTQCPIEMLYSKEAHTHTYTHRIFMFSVCKDFQTKLCVGELTLNLTWEKHDFFFFFLLFISPHATDVLTSFSLKLCMAGYIVCYWKTQYCNQNDGQPALVLDRKEARG